MLLVILEIVVPVPPVAVEESPPVKRSFAHVCRRHLFYHHVPAGRGIHLAHRRSHIIRVVVITTLMILIGHHRRRVPNLISDYCSDGADPMESCAAPACNWASIRPGHLRHSVSSFRVERKQEGSRPDANSFLLLISLLSPDFPAILNSQSYFTLVLVQSYQHMLLSNYNLRPCIRKM
jgi:hypothetical protein